MRLAPDLMDRSPPPTSRRQQRRHALLSTLALLAAPWLPRSTLAQSPVANASESDTASMPSYADSPRVTELAAQLAQQTGLNAKWIAGQLGRAQFQPDVARLIIPGKPGQKNWAAYRKHFVETTRIRAGSDFVQEFGVWLSKAENRFGVDPAIITGILGVETIYGRDMGNFRVLDALTTLSLDFPTAAPKDRSDYFSCQLGDYLLWCHQNDFDASKVKGSYAGAIGMPQFMPGNILRYALSFDGGSKVDIIENPADAIGSVGNFLAGHGWQRKQPTYFPLVVPNSIAPDALARLLEPDIVPSFTAQQLKAAGFSLPSRVLDYEGKLAVVQLPNANDEPDYILGTDNFYVVTRYNHSALYALAVIELGNAALAAAQT